MRRKIKVAVIGAGKWGSNIIRTLTGLSEYEISYIVSRKREDLLKFSHIGCGLVTRMDELSGIDAVIVSTPASSHASVALPFIKKGLPVFIEKPITTTVLDAERLYKAEKKSGARVFAGYIHLYNPAYLKTKECVKKIGKIRYILCEGANNGPYRSDVSAMWDWATHDVSAVLDLVGEKPKSITAWGVSSLRPGTNDYDLSQIKISFPGKVVGLIMSSRLFPEKRKKMFIVGEKSTVVFDDAASDKVMFLEGMGPEVLHSKSGIKILQKTGKIKYPHYNSELPLTRELRSFARVVLGKENPPYGMKMAIDVTKILASAEKSIATQKPVSFPV